MNVPSTSPTRLRQIALIAKDIARARYLLTTILDTEVVYVDPDVSRWGIENILGGDIIEVCSPLKAGLHTPVGRQLAKRDIDAGGYMMIMQTVDADARRRYIESHGLASVVFSHSHPGSGTADNAIEPESVCIQYHPRGVPGGIMPELDSHATTAQNPSPLAEYSPWHACGPGSYYPVYSAAMRRNSHLRLVGATLRLSPDHGVTTPHAAARKWHDLFGIPYQDDELIFTNSRVRFLPASPGQPEGLESITIQVTGKPRFDNLLKRVADEGLCGDGWTNMLGVKWYFVLKDESDSGSYSTTRQNSDPIKPSSKL
ncbi:hypothetical protein PV08_07235 [Exophiala spinifera]|uniref:Glyoxalase-like domain-containing protein n=1 Tax=Exophiala spinifera TaxID=91928 RepID=A0A0D1YHQ6_9EURO|nr:uncharacterized protein PV08_07235 [Exophiala spinifera]KIW14451.1 hypothetical protein PV08_07235 [Exophiala spinifera]